jgi:hypothetical protein
MLKDKKGNEDGDNALLFAMPEFRTKRSDSGDRRGLSSGFEDAASTTPTDEEDGGGSPSDMFVDWSADHDDKNELHMPNRIGFTMVDWCDPKKGYVSGKRKLKKKDRAAGKYNKSDLKVRARARVSKEGDG